MTGLNSTMSLQAYARRHCRTATKCTCLTRACLEVVLQQTGQTLWALTMQMGLHAAAGCTVCQTLRLGEAAVASQTLWTSSSGVLTGSRPDCCCMFAGVDHNKVSRRPKHSKLVARPVVTFDADGHQSDPHALFCCHVFLICCAGCNTMTARHSGCHSFVLMPCLHSSNAIGC